MNDYISREAALSAQNKSMNLNEMRERLKRIPAADVRPVVLCRDCINYVESDEANGEKMCVIDADWSIEDGYYYGLTVYTQPDWFCAGGKKREES